MEDNNLKRSALDNNNQKNNKKWKQNTERNNSKVWRSELHKPPTTEELNQLKETEILFNSNLFRLQTEELIKEISLKEKRKKEIDLWIEKLKDYINNLPEYDDIKLSDFNASLDQKKPVKLKGILKRIAQYKPLKLKTDHDTSIKLLKPCSIETVGLYPLNVTTGPIVHIAINVVIPKSYFLAKDYLNARYLIKRSLYLSYLALHLKSFNFASDISYTYLNGNHLHPILYITLRELKKVIFEVLVSPENDSFKLSRFNSNKSNLRWSYWKNIQEKDVENEEIDNLEEQHYQTPWYNAIMAYDVTLTTRNIWSFNILQEQEGARAALQLFNIWLRQRELHVLGDELMLAIIAHLAETGRINRHMSSYQAIRNMWLYLVNADWTSKMYDLGSDLVFLDHTGHCNLAAHVPETVFRRIQCEAKIALQYLDIGDIHAFHKLFMFKIPFCMQYDAIINIYNNSDIDNIYDQIEYKDKLDYLTFKYPLIVNQLSKILQNALTDRIIYIVPKLKESSVWEIESKIPVDIDDTLYVSFGVGFNTSNMFRLVDIGPQAYDPKAAVFREFWGGKAELRRFKDGSISEAVYWPATYVRDKRQICKNIIEYILKDKLELKNYNIVYDQFDSIININANSPMEEGNLKIISEFDELAKKLRELKLPLSISSVQGVSEAFSHSDTYPLKPQNFKTTTQATFEWQNMTKLKDTKNLKETPEFVAPVEGVIQMAAHSKWPNELEAMRSLCTAFYLQMGEQLKRKGLFSAVQTDHLDVVSGGLVIRLSLFHPRELTLLDETSSTTRELHCTLIPRLRGALAGLHSRYPALGPGAALARRWLRSQLLDVPATVTELLCADIYLPSNTASTPALPQRVFLHFLELIARYSWSTQPLILDISDEITTAQRDEFDVSFRDQRDDFPPLCIITLWDHCSRVTAKAPNALELQRLRLLAEHSLQLIQQQIHSRSLFNAVSFFKPNLKGYNVIIHLHSSLNARRNESLFTDNIDYDSIVFDSVVPNKVPVINFNPAELYLEELRKIYNDFAVFFHDIHGGNIIAVLWKPNIFEKQNFKVSHVAGMKLADKDKLQINIHAIIEDFRILGDEIVKDIEIL